jgi:hypothetical protein
MIKKISSTLVVGLCLSLGGLWGQDSISAPAPKPDNTTVNQRDRSAAEPTAEQQKETPPDRELARQIRRALVADTSLSTYAHNVKVIAQGGVVTLKGPVRSDREKQVVEAKAVEVAGSPDRVKSELDVSVESGKPSAYKQNQ